MLPREIAKYFSKSVLVFSGQGKKPPNSLSDIWCQNQILHVS